MATAAEHARSVLSAVIPNRRDLLEVVLRRLTPEHFTDKTYQNFYKFLQRYSETTGGAVFPRKFLDDLLQSKSNTGQLQLFLETYDLFAETKVEDSEFLWSVEQLRELAAEKATQEAITNAMDVLKNGKETERGQVMKGHEDARAYILEAFTDIDRDLSMQEAPEGDLKNESIEMLEDYAERKALHATGASDGVRFGIPELDAKVGGLQRGEIVLLAGYSSDGKTTLATQLAWSAAIEQGKNVVFLTTETLRPQVRRKIVARHSNLPIFGLVEGLNTRDLKAGTLSPEHEQKLSQVVNDLAKNPAYGHLYIAQVPRSSTIASLEARLARIQREFDIDLVVMDYLALLVSDRHRATTREELAAIMKEAKQVATTFNNGQGVPLVSPWQVSRMARENAEKVGRYTSAGLSETAEATNSADVIISLLAPTDNTNRRADVQMQILKARDGETADGINVEVDYATSAFRGKRLPGALTSASGGNALNSLFD